MIELEKQIADPLGNILNYQKIWPKIYRHRLFIAALAVGTTIFSITFSLRQPNEYTASATLLPVEKSSSDLSSLIAGMGGGVGMLATQAGIGKDTTAQKFVTILQSRTISDSIIQKENLAPVLLRSSWDSERNQWKEPLIRIAPPKRVGPLPEDVREALRDVLSIKFDKNTNLITLTYTDVDPLRSARVLNALIGELDVFLKKNSLSAAKRNREFIEDQLTKVRLDLSGSEIALKNYQQTNGVVSLGAQTEAAVKSYSDLKAKLMASQIELSLLEKSALLDDPRLALKRLEVTEVKRQLAKFEDENDPMAFGRAPSIGLGLARLKRDLMINEKLFELLTQQYHVAKIQEAQESESFQILDAAVPPEKKSGPKRAYIVLVSLVSALIIGSSLALILETLRERRQLTKI